jgi:thiamine pyrophosphokinase
MPGKRAIIFANGTVPDIRAVAALLKPDDVWIAADGGSRHALALGRAPDIVIGDCDSLPPGVEESLRQAGSRVNRFPAEKDQTDLELALDYAIREAFDQILIVGGTGGRIDQTLANIALLFRPELAGREACMDDGREELIPVRGSATITGAPGDIVSLIPFGGDATGIRTEELAFPLSSETLHLTSSRGVSNRLASAKANIQVEKGYLLCIHTRSE